MICTPAITLWELPCFLYREPSWASQAEATVLAHRFSAKWCLWLLQNKDPNPVSVAVASSYQLLPRLLPLPWDPSKTIHFYKAQAIFLEAFWEPLRKTTSTLLWSSRSPPAALTPVRQQAGADSGSLCISWSAAAKVALCPNLVTSTSLFFHYAIFTWLEFSRGISPT